MKVRSKNPFIEKLKMVLVYGITAFCIFFTCVVFCTAIFKTCVIYLKRNAPGCIYKFQHSKPMLKYYEIHDRWDKWFLDNWE